MMLTTALDQAYPFTATAKSVVGIGVLSWSGDKPQAFCSAAFLLSQCAQSLWADWAGSRKARRCSTGMPTCSVPPTQIGVLGRFVKRTGAHIMTNTPLVPVFTGTISNQSVQFCNARDLYQFLEVGKDFSTWIKNRIAEYGFIQDEDYSPILGNRSDGKPGKRRTEYHLTLDMAKELAMVENNEKGRQIRRYFISLERKAINSRKTRSLSSKKYNYPRNRLEQPYFAEKKPASLSLSMLANTKEFTSQLKALLNELRTDGHNVDAAWDEYQAMDEIIRHCDGFMDEVIELALAKKLNYSNYSLRNK